MQNDKIKILFFSDHPLSTSGVGTQSRWLIAGLLSTGKYSFRCFGGAIRHDNYQVHTVNPDFIIKPIDGFGDKNIVRQALLQEKPDLLLLFTDPRFFSHIWEIEDEIHDVCPIAYNHLWDNGPWPEFNRYVYESTDLINCINYPTYEMVSKFYPKKTNYIPHALPHDVIYPLKEQDVLKAKENILGKNKLDHFILTFVSRNARRKVPSDIILSFSQFLSRIENKYRHKKATLLMHCDPFDPEGPNLLHVVEQMGVKDNVIFSKERVDFPQMNILYNISDAVINISCAEGFGLSVLEAKMAAKPVIALKTGGLSRQVEDHETGVQYGVALEPEVKTLVGTQAIPYIYEDHISHNTVCNAIEKVYEWGPQKRKEIGNSSREHAIKNYNIQDLIKNWDDSLQKLIVNWKQSKQKRWTSETI